MVHSSKLSLCCLCSIESHVGGSLVNLKWKICGMQNLYALLKLTTTPTKEKKRSQLGPLLNAPVIVECVEKVLPVKVLVWYCQYFSATVSVLVLAIVFGQSINIGIANTFHKYC